MKKVIIKKEIQFTKGIKFFGVLAAGLFLLPACGKAEAENHSGASVLTDSGVMEADFEYQFVAESENGYYIWERLNQDQFYPRLMFMDKVSGRVVPLCNRPDCIHEGKECNAYLPEIDFGADGVNKQYLQYYEGDLYAIGLSKDAYVSVFRIKADGSEWEICTKLYRTDYATTGHWKTPEILIDGGYVYFVDWYQKIKKLERIPIDGGSAEVVFEEDSDASAVDIYRIGSNGGLLFFQVMRYPDELPENVVGSLYCYDPKTGKCDLIKELIGPYSIRSGFVYYGNAEGLCRYSIQDETTEILVDQPMNVPNITLTEDDIILCDQMADCTLTIYDYEGKELAKVANTLGLYWYFGGNSEILFGACADEAGLRLCYLDLTRPLDELKWEELKAE